MDATSNLMFLCILAFAEGSNNWLINDWPNGRWIKNCDTRPSKVIFSNLSSIAHTLAIYSKGWQGN